MGSLLLSVSVKSTSCLCSMRSHSRIVGSSMVIWWSYSGSEEGSLVSSACARVLYCCGVMLLQCGVNFGWSGISKFSDILMAVSSVVLSGSRLSVGIPAFWRSWSHHSWTYGLGARSWLFSRNSPYGMRISPTSMISSIWCWSSCASSGVCGFMTVPFLSFMVGPSMVVTVAAPWALPGNSVLIWLPVTIWSSIVCILIGLNPLAASPRVLARPYRSLHPPFVLALLRMGRPAITSLRNLSFGSQGVCAVSRSSV